jgi:HSP20 family protein
LRQIKWPASVPGPLSAVALGLVDATSLIQVNVVQARARHDVVVYSPCRRRSAMFRSLVPFSRRTDEPFVSLQREMNRLFEDALRGLPAISGDAKAAMAPSMDVKETDNAIEVQTELPGVDQKDVDVTYANGVLAIKGEKKAEKEDKKAGYHLSERSYGSFYRSVQIEDVDADKIAAKFDKGVLTVTLPKLAAAQASTKKIEIKAS